MKEHLIKLLDYELWANQRVIEALATLSHPPARAVAVMGHILSAQHVWYGRIAREYTFVAIWEDIPVSWMIETAERQHRQLVSYLAGIRESDTAEPVAYVNSEGVAFTRSLVEILTHMSHHAAYHRGQVVQLIRPLLDKAPVTDYIVWASEGKP